MEQNKCRRTHYIVLFCLLICLTFMNHVKTAEDVELTVFVALKPYVTTGKTYSSLITHPFPCQKQC